MIHADVSPCAAPVASANPFNLDELERHAVRSPTVAWGLITGLPALGIFASLVVGLPLFAALMGGCFVMATALVCRRAMIAFTSQTLRLLVTARLVIVVVLASLLFCTSGSAWMAVVSALVLWLTADRLLGRNALYDLWKLMQDGPLKSGQNASC